MNLGGIVKRFATTGRLSRTLFEDGGVPIPISDDDGPWRVNPGVPGFVQFRQVSGGSDWQADGAFEYFTTLPIGIYARESVKNLEGALTRQEYMVMLSRAHLMNRGWAIPPRAGDVVAVDGVLCTIRQILERRSGQDLVYLCQAEG